MKRRVEAGDFCETGKVLDRKADDEKRRRVMQWREGTGRLDLPEDSAADMAVMAQPLATMHDAMTDGDRWGHSGVVKQRLDEHDGLLRAGYRHPFRYLDMARGIARVELGHVATDVLGGARDERFRVLPVDPVKSEFERGRAAVEREYAG